MTGKVAERRLAADLARLLAPRFPGIAVQVGEHERWDRPCVTFRWAGFADLLPEERFHRLVRAIPEAFRTDRLGGFVWLELAPHETVEAFLNLPRSEDVADSEASILSGLVEVGFFDSLADQSHDYHYLQS